MKYSENVLSQAMDELDSKRLDAEAERQRHIELVNQKYPEIARINNDLAQTMSLISKSLKANNVQAEIKRIAEENLNAQKQRRELLRAFGYPEDYLDIHYNCTKCGDTGYVMGHRCECLDKLLEKYAVMELNSSCRVALSDFEEFDLKYYIGEDRVFMSQTLEMCKRYAAGFSTDSDSLFFLGGTGLGKTFLSSAIAKAVLQRGYNVAYDSISNFLRKLEDEHFGRASGNTMDLLLKSDLVILDDLGSEFRSGFNDSAVYDIINSRINYKLPTIISSNLSFKELSGRYNERIVSRLGGIYIPIELRGRDIRMQKRMSQ